MNLTAKRKPAGKKKTGPKKPKRSMSLVSTRTGTARTTAKSSTAASKKLKTRTRPTKDRSMQLIAKKKTTKPGTTSGAKKSGKTGKSARPGKLLLTAGKPKRRRTVGLRTGRFSLFRPKVRGKAYPVQDNIAGWALFKRLTKQTGLSGSDLFTLSLRLLAREYPALTHKSAVAIAARMDERTFKLMPASAA